MNKIAPVIAASLVLSLALAGCTSARLADNEPVESTAPESAPAQADDAETATEEEPAVAGPQDLVLGETAFGMDGEYGWYAVQVTNPNEDYIFDFAAIDVEAFDADGVLIDSDSSYSTILSGESYYVGTFFDIGSAKIDRIEVRGPTADAASYAAADETGSFTLGEIKTGSEYDYLTVEGTLTSNFSEDQDMVNIHLIARNADGKIIGVDQTYTDRVPAGGTAKWDTSFWEVPLDSKVTAYAHL